MDKTDPCPCLEQNAGMDNVRNVSEDFWRRTIEKHKTDHVPHKILGASFQPEGSLFLSKDVSVHGKNDVRLHGKKPKGEVMRRMLLLICLGRDWRNADRNEDRTD